MNSQILEQWELHQSSTFPHGYGGEEVEGIDLALLDTETSGCLHTFITNEGHLDLWRTATLGICYRDLTIVVKNLTGEAKEYFLRLETLSSLVLKSIAVEKNNSQ